ncbi:MmpS family transport accessory protein [Nocardia iowensis]|uniref:MmpS family protein n=1 Tax=Nocardia iowensis TaxID=204891 RepID=A0ABX8RVP4_NOCIO|nr:MmpS family transport accessory protein [Nocardia iowensis]QXN93057.1 MmpS family protein [Nocardia iowensis]
MKSAWVYGVVVLVLGVTALFIARLRLSEIPDLAIGHSTPPPVLGRPSGQVIDYEIDGPSGTSVRLSYLDEQGQVRDVSTGLPWRTSVRTDRLTLPTGVVAQSDADHVSCRIVINGEPRDVQVSDGPFAAVNCKVPVS